ncbi:hypothetical protein VCHC81A2_2541, partial [Vibrio cholerae HC-81A2]
MLCLA